MDLLILFMLNYSKIYTEYLMKEFYLLNILFIFFSICLGLFTTLHILNITKRLYQKKNNYFVNLNLSVILFCSLILSYTVCVYLNIKLFNPKLCLPLAILSHNIIIWISLKDKFSAYSINFKLKHIWIISIISLNSIGAIIYTNSLINKSFSYTSSILISLAFFLFIGTVIVIQFLHKNNNHSKIYATLLSNLLYPNIIILFLTCFDIYMIHLNLKLIDQHFIVFLSPLQIILISYLFLTRGYNYLFKQLPQSTHNTFNLFLNKKNISKREYDIIQHLLQGYSNKQIATKCFISNNTVKTHLVNIYKKLDITKRTDLYKLLYSC